MQGVPACRRFRGCTVCNRILINDTSYYRHLISRSHRSAVSRAGLTSLATPPSSVDVRPSRLGFLLPSVESAYVVRPSSFVPRIFAGPQFVLPAPSSMALVPCPVRRSVTDSRHSPVQSSPWSVPRRPTLSTLSPTRLVSHGSFRHVFRSIKTFR